MSQAAAAALSALRAFLGDNRLADPENMSEHWNVRQQEDAWLVTPKRNSRGGSMYRVRGELVQPFQVGRMTLEEAYAQLLRRGDA